MTPARSLVLAILALFLLAPAALAQEQQETARHPSPGGDVSAELSYTKLDDFNYENVRIKITRAGNVLHDALVPEPCEDCPPAPAGLGDPENPSLRLRDLNSDGEPEALVDLYTGGAHCCTYTQIYRYDAATNAYRRLKAAWGDYGYELTDLNGDGTPEFRSADWRFAGAFTAYAASGAPIQIWRFGGSRMVNVTRQFRSLVKANLRDFLRLYKEIRRDPDVPDVRGFLAAYVADKYLLGQGDTAFDLVNAAHRRGELKALPGDTSPAGKRYITALRRFLRKTGYR
ncbi:MAG: hypothetical protein M3340_05350 [Actinomycetota bacterium]|nr:hypothetical protein [Actinomycetota bacterium]